MKLKQQQTKAARQDLLTRARQSAAAKDKGAEFQYPMGGSYNDVVKFNKNHRDSCWMEANHTPAMDAYVGTPYADVTTEGNRPAHAMLFYHHRAIRGQLGGASSTGGSGINKEWSAGKIRELMKDGKFGEAMLQDMNDLTNTTFPNFGFYALALLRAAVYAKRGGLIESDESFKKIVDFLGQYLRAEQVSEACQDVEVATEEKV
jgi:hypothetical protein